MRYWIVALALIVAWPVAASAQSFVADPPVIDSTHDAPTAWTVKCGSASGGPYTATASSSASAATVTPIVVSSVVGNGTWFCISTMSNAGGESSASAELRFPPNRAPNPPRNFRVQ